MDNRSLTERARDASEKRRRDDREAARREAERKLAEEVAALDELLSTVVGDHEPPSENLAIIDGLAFYASPIPGNYGYTLRIRAACPDCDGMRRSYILNSLADVGDAIAGAWEPHEHFHLAAVEDPALRPPTVFEVFPAGQLPQGMDPNHPMFTDPLDPSPGERILSALADFIRFYTESP